MLVLDKLNKEIVKIISEKGLHSSEISRKIKMPRTTIQYRLKQMEKLGLVKKNYSGRKTIWINTFKDGRNKNIFSVYEGKNFINAYRKLLSLPKNTEIFSIQGSEAAKNSLRTLPASFIKEAHSIFKRRKIIMRGISNQKALKNFETLEKSLTKSHFGRTLGLKLFSGNNFTSDAEIFSSKRLLILSSPGRKRAVLIRDKAITEIMYDTTKLLFEIIEDKNTFDLNDYIKEKIF